MNRCFLMLLSVVTIFLFSGSAWANTFYVSTQGNDNNPGSTNAPWATLQHAVDSIAPGDTIIVRAGTYPGCRIGNSGLAGAVKTLKAETGANVLINVAGQANRHSSNIEVELFDDTVSYWVIDGFEVANSARYGIDIRVTDHITVQNCFVHNSAVTGIFLAFSYYPVIQNNESASNGEHGIYQSNSGDFPVIKGNRLHHNFSCGLHMNGDASFTPGDGIISFGIIEKNIVWENGTGGGSGINLDGGSDNIIRNNLLFNNHASGISLYAIDGAEGSSRNKVYNNTIIQATGSRWCINIPESSGVASPTGNIIKNNILYNPSSFRGSVLSYSDVVSGFESDYNIVVDHFSSDGGDTSFSLAQWQSLGYDLHSSVAAPNQLFVNPANNDYHLIANSPAIGAGAILAEVTDDLDNNPRSQVAAYDAGCYIAQAAGGGNPNPLSITSFSPLSGPVGTIVSINGTSFTQTTSVKFNGVSASFTVVSDTKITAAVPAAATAGPISVSKSSDTATSSGSFTVTTPLTISSFTPLSGVVGTVVTITGTNMGSASDVKFNGVSVNAITFVTATSIKVSVPIGATTGKITVSNQTSSFASTAVFKVPPTISGFSPANGLPGDVITINGSNIGSPTSVKFGVAVAAIVSAAYDQIAVKVPATAATGIISVTTADGTAASATSFIVIKTPAISSFTPVSAAIGSTVTINGSNFFGVTEVKFNGVSAGTPQVISATSIKTTVPVGATTGKISVINAAGTATSLGIFKISPRIDSFTATTAIANDSVTITGLNLKVGAANPTVRIGTIVLPVVSATETTVVVTIPTTASTGKISVATVDGTGTSAANLTVIKPPTISSFSPASAAIGTQLTINGSNFFGVTEVKFNGISAGTPQVKSATSISTVIPVGATTGKVSITNAAGTATSLGIFKISPRVDSFTATTAIANDSVTITGLNLKVGAANPTVRIGTIVLPVVSATETTVVVTIPTTASTGKISVATVDGTGTSAANLTVIKPPTISSFTPTSGRIGTLVTISGANISTVTQVNFNGVSAGMPQVISPTSIRIAVPQGAVTGKISGENKAGTAASAGMFTVLP